MNQRCADPCPGACGVAAVCNVINHTPICTCMPGLTGDPFTYCRAPPPPRKNHLLIECFDPINSNILTVYVYSLPALARDEPKDLCNPSPCGANANCANGICSCIPGYGGDPYHGCRPECVLNSECPRDKACIRSKCVDPCPGTCGQAALCDVINHIPMCSCPPGYTGNAFVSCRIAESRIATNFLFFSDHHLINIKIVLLFFFT